MNGTDVSHDALERLSAGWDALTPEAQKAARYVLENPADVGVSTVREIAEAARVKPNTVVRMTRQAGFEGYEDFRAPFRDAIRRGPPPMAGRARWLQDIRKSGDMGGLHADMVVAAVRNIEETFSAIPVEALKAAAEDIWTSRQVFTLGVGVNNASARIFSYLASTGMVRFHAIPQQGNSATDDLSFADAGDMLIAITCKPFRREVIEATAFARDQGLTIIGISDSPASPVIRWADHGFVVAVDTPQFFPSSVSIIALLETLLSFVVAVASDEIVDRVDRFHQRRHRLGFYAAE